MSHAFAPLLIFAMLLATRAVAGDFAMSQGLGVSSVNEGLFAAGVPDLQNYCSSAADVSDPPQQDRAEGLRQLRVMVDDIITERPEFVLQVGDWTDSTGGVDQDTEATSGHLDDPDTFTALPTRYSLEWLCVKENFVDPIEAAGIPVFGINGNHDSCVDHERTFPAAAFVLKSYYYDHQARAARCGSGFTDTMQRAALFSTSIGSICVVGMRYNGTENDATDIAWVNSTIGCGAAHPTIIMNHNGVGLTDATYNAAGNEEVFMAVFGHQTPLGLTAAVQTVSGSGSHKLGLIGANWQESSLNCQGVPDGVHPGIAMHTGIGWWVKLKIVPRTSTIHVQARSPVLGGAGSNLACSYNNVYQSGALVFSPTLCSRFPTLKGC